MDPKIKFFEDQIKECDRIISNDNDCVNVFFARHKKQTLEELINKYQLKTES